MELRSWTVRSSRTALFWLLAVTALVGASCKSAGPTALKDDQPATTQSPTPQRPVTTPAAAGPVDVNDINFLFPLDARKMPYPEIKVTAVLGKGGQLWPTHLFDEVMKQARSPATAIKGSGGTRQIEFIDDADKIESWRVFGFRFIPCVLTSQLITKPMNNGEPPGCATQIRFIAQPLKSTGGEQDVAVHLVFTLGLIPSRNNNLSFLSRQVVKLAFGDSVANFAEFRGAFLGLDSKRNKRQGKHYAEMIKEIQAIKQASLASGVDTNGKPLGVHPGLAQELTQSQGAPGPIAQAVRDFGLKNIGASDMTNISFMGTIGRQPWIFFGGSLDPELPKREIGFGSFTQAQLMFKPKGALPLSPGMDNDQAIMLSFSDQPNVVPTPTSPKTTAHLFDPGPSALDVASLAHDVDNPNITTNFTTDCVSCHTTTTRMQLLDKVDGNKPNRLRTPAGVTGFIDTAAVARGRWNIRNFGYFNSTASITTRTLTEVIDATAILNAIITGQEGAPGPGLDCGDKENEVWECTVKDGRSCFQVCAVKGHAQ